MTQQLEKQMTNNKQLENTHWKHTGNNKINKNETNGKQRNKWKPNENKQLEKQNIGKHRTTL